MFYYWLSPEKGLVMDVGSGNNSLEWFRTLRSDLYYVGIDVTDYNQTDDPSNFANEYITASPSELGRFMGLSLLFGQLLNN